MKNLPPAIIRASNAIDQSDPWLVLLDIYLVGTAHTTVVNGITISYSERLSLVNNNEDITFNGVLYYAFSFNYEQPSESGKGEIPTVTISVSNVSRIVQGYVELYEGGVGSVVVMTVVNAGLLAENYAELTTNFTVLGSKCSAQWVAFSLGSANPFNKRFPPDIYSAQHCRFKYKGPHCKYAGIIAACDHTFDDCRLHYNEVNFGGHLGLDGRGARVWG